MGSLPSFWHDLTPFLRHDEDGGLLAWMTGIPLFDGFPRRELRHISRLLHRREYETGECVFHQGEAGHGVYLIQSGAIEILSAEMDQQTVRLVTLQPGAVFGEMALLDESPRSATARTLEPSVLYGFFEGDLDHIERTRPQTATRLLRNLGRMLALRLRQANEQQTRTASPQG